MPRTKVRVVGQGFTAFTYRGVPIMSLEGVRDEGQNIYTTGPGGNAEAIYPLTDDQGNATEHASEIVTGRVLQIGTLTFTVRERWNRYVWQHLQGLAGTNRLNDVFRVLQEDPTQVTCQKIIQPPGAAQWYGDVYHGVVISSIPDGDEITLGALSTTKTITASYTHRTPFQMAAAR